MLWSLGCSLEPPHSVVSAFSCRCHRLRDPLFLRHKKERNLSITPAPFPIILIRWCTFVPQRCSSYSRSSTTSIHFLSIWQYNFRSVLYVFLLTQERFHRLSYFPCARSRTLFVQGMFSWFPLYFPLRTPVLLKPGDTASAHLWRCTSSTKVWYEWALTSPAPSPIHNPNGRSYWIGL